MARTVKSMSAEQAAEYFRKRDEAAQAEKVRRVARAEKLAYAPQAPVSPEDQIIANMTWDDVNPGSPMTEGKRLWINTMKDLVAKSAEQFSLTRWVNYRHLDWRLARFIEEPVTLNTGEVAGFAGGYTIAELLPSDDGQLFVLAYSQLLNRNVQLDTKVVRWMEPPVVPTPPTVTATITCEDQVNEKIQDLSAAVASLAPGAAWDARFQVRAAWSYPDGLTVEETVDPEGVVRYSVRDKHGCSGEAESLSEATREMWIEVCLEGWCDVCEDRRVQVVCAPEIMGAHYFGLCQNCYMDRPIEPDHIDEWFDLEVWRSTASCSEHAEGFGRCWRLSPAGTHLHLIDRAGVPTVFGVRASGAEWFEIVGRPVPLSSYIDICRHGAERHATCG